jgi:hypothetical protein
VDKSRTLSDTRVFPIVSSIFMIYFTFSAHGHTAHVLFVPYWTHYGNSRTSDTLLYFYDLHIAFILNL